MASLTFDQQRAVALASARARAAEAGGAQPSNQGGFLSRLNNAAAGINNGLYSLPQSAMEIGARGLDATGLTDNAYKTLHNEFQDSRQYAAPVGAADPNSGAFQGGNIAGGIVSTLPAMGLKVPGLAAKLPAVAKVVNGVLQGGAAAAGTSNSSDAPLGQQITLGGAFGGAFPALGVIGGKVMPTLLGGVTGQGARSIAENFVSGVKGGAASAIFRGNMRGSIPWSDVVDKAKGALAKMRADRGAAYRSGMVDISKDPTVLDFTPVDNALEKSNSINSYKGQDLSPNTTDVRQQINSTIAEWRGLDPAEYHTPEGFDALKQKIGGIKDAQPFNTPQRAIASDAYNAVRKTIADQAPTYNKVMGDYSAASDHLDALTKELSLGRKGNPNTVLRKLQSVMNDNVNTSWGDRAKYAQTLEDNGATNLMPALAGQSSSAILPRGLARYGDLAVALSSIAHPLAALPLAFASPRLTGEVVHATGRALGGTGRLAQSGANALGIDLSKLPVQSLAAILGATAPGTLASQGSR